MNIQDAIDVIESVAGFTDESTPVGEAWLEVLSFIHRRTTLAQPEPEVAGPITDGRPMNQSYWLALLRHDAYAASFQSVDQYRSALIERVTSPRAQPEPVGVIAPSNRPIISAPKLSIFAVNRPAIEPVPVAQPVAERWLQAVAKELAKAEAKHPEWPTDPLHAIAIIGEEFGELTQAVLQVTYEPGKSLITDVQREAVQTAAMALRFLQSMDAYVYADDTNTHRQDNALPTPGAEVG